MYYGMLDMCENDLSTSDPYGDSCNQYDNFPSWCGMYDSDDFHSTVQCCVCGGGLGAADDYYGLGAVCENDLSSADAYGDDCNRYDDFPSWCGLYDDENFNSSEQCCICGGGFGGLEEECVNDYSTADSTGDDCDSYAQYPGWCGNYDTEDFHSMTQCCACMELGMAAEYYYSMGDEWYY